MDEEHVREFVRVVIDETARNSLGEEPELFNVVVKSFDDVDDVRKFLVDRYGRMPGGRNKVYTDTLEGTQEVGFTHSYWNMDWSHAKRNKWYQTDWISISSVVESLSVVNHRDLQGSG